MCTKPGADAAVRVCRLYFLGGEPGVAEEARATLTQRYPGLRVVGTHWPPVDFEQHAPENRKALDAVRAGAPLVLYVGLGSAKQERWVRAHMHEYEPAVSIGVGIGFSVVAGRVRRAPRWMQRVGLEWVHRLGCEPRRLWKRYMVDDMGFFGIAWQQWRLRRRTGWPPRVPNGVQLPGCVEATARTGGELEHTASAAIEG